MLTAARRSGRRKPGRAEHRRWLAKLARLQSFGEEGAEAILREAEGRMRGNPWPDAETATRLERYMDAAEEIL